MKKVLLIIICNFLFAVTLWCQTDDPKCTGPVFNIFTKMNDFYVEGCEEIEFKTLEIWVEANSRTIKKEGKYTKIRYRLNPGSTRKIVGQQIVSNYANAVKKSGGEVVKNSDDMAYHVTKNGKSYWAYLSVSPYAGVREEYYIQIIEEEGMKQEVEANIQEQLADKGKAVFYGIYFPVGKSNVMPESRDAIQAIADYLKANPKSSIFIVGHTDNTGDYLKNIKLSKDRALAVKTYLVAQFKVDVKRLISDGVGPLSPVASNGSEDGRKLNRRVEVVLK